MGGPSCWYVRALEYRGNPSVGSGDNKMATVIGQELGGPVLAHLSHRSFCRGDPDDPEGADVPLKRIISHGKSSPEGSGMTERSDGLLVRGGARMHFFFFFLF